MVQIYYGDIKGDTDIYEHLLTLPNVQKRRSAFIVESELNPLSTLPLEKIDYPLQVLGSPPFFPPFSLILIYF